MAKKVRRPAPPECGLHLAVENEDWVAIRGSTADLERLGQLLIEFARDQGRQVAILDSPSPLFRPGSLGLTFYRSAEPTTGADRPPA